MRIAIWSDSCLTLSTGVGNALRHLLRHLDELKTGDEYTLFYASDYPPRSLSFLQLSGAFSEVRLPFARRMARTSWLLGRGHVDDWIGPHDVIFNPVPFHIPSRKGQFRSFFHDLSTIQTPEAFSIRDRAVSWVSYRQVLRRADHVLTNSQDTRQSLITLFGIPPEGVHVAHLGVDSAFSRASEESIRKFELLYSAGKRYVFWVGEIQRRKNLVALVDAFARLRQRRHDVRLVLAGGSGFGAADVHSAVRRASLSGLVTFPGHLDLPSLVAGLSGASVFAFPSLHEGFGLPILEAFACGTPVAASNAGAIPEIVGEAGLLFSPTDVGAIESAVAAILDTPALSASLASRGLERVREFSWARHAVRVHSFFHLPVDSPLLSGRSQSEP